MPIGLPSQRPEPKSAWTLSSSPIERTIAPEFAATGRWSTRSLPGKDGPNSGQPTRAAEARATSSIAAKVWRAGGWASVREVGRVHEVVAQREDHRLDVGGHARAVERLERAGDDVQPPVQLEVEAGGDVVGDRDLAPGVAGAAAQQHPPVRLADGLPVDRVHEVRSAQRARLEMTLEVVLGALGTEAV